MLVGSVWRDLRYGWRGFRKQPGFTLLAILTLANRLTSNPFGPRQTAL